MNACLLSLCLLANLQAAPPAPSAATAEVAPAPVEAVTLGPRRAAPLAVQAARPAAASARPARPRRGQPAPDRFFGEDKFMHFFGSFLVTSLAASGARAAGAGDDSSLWIGAAAGAGLGIAKEVHDIGRPNETPSFIDLLWDVGGVGAATALQAQTRQ